VITGVLVAIPTCLEQDTPSQIAESVAKPGDFTHLKRASFGCSSRTTPSIKRTTDHIGAFTGSTVRAKLPKRRIMNPGIGNGQRRNTIPQISSPIAPNKTKAIPNVFRIAGL